MELSGGAGGKSYGDGHSCEFPSFTGLLIYYMAMKNQGDFMGSIGAKKP
jgi:hypothetical protein